MSKKEQVLAIARARYDDAVERLRNFLMEDSQSEKRAWGAFLDLHRAKEQVQDYYNTQRELDRYMNEDGMLVYADADGHPVVYLDKTYDLLCGECANRVMQAMEEERWVDGVHGLDIAYIHQWGHLSCDWCHTIMWREEEKGAQA